MRYMLGIDVGGTFTDFVAYDRDTRQVEVWKSLSAPKNPVDGIMAGLQQFDRKADIANIRLGTTVATNALLERTGATVAYVTTKGHRDVLFIQRGNRKFHYDMSWVKPKPLAKRRHCFEIVERLSADGEVVTPLDEAQTRAVARQIAATARGQRGRGHAAVLLHQSGARTAREGDLRRGGAGPAGVDFL